VLEPIGRGVLDTPVKPGHDRRNGLIRRSPRPPTGKLAWAQPGHNPGAQWCLLEGRLVVGCRRCFRVRCPI